MFKPTQPLFRRLQRLALTTKQVNGGYYKGTGTGSMGRHTKYGGYVVEWRKVRTYVVPADMKGFMVSSSDERERESIQQIFFIFPKEIYMYADFGAPTSSHPSLPRKSKPRRASSAKILKVP